MSGIGYPVELRKLDHSPRRHVSNAVVQSVPPTSLPPQEVIVRLFALADALLIASHFIDTVLT
jgi:hypothetical protein